MFDKNGSALKQRGIRQPHNTAAGAQDGQVPLSAGMIAMDRRSPPGVARRQSVAVGATDGRDVVRARAAGITDDFQDDYDFVSSVGKRAERMYERVLVLMFRIVAPGPIVLFGLDDTPTKRCGPKVEGAGLHPIRRRGRRGTNGCLVMRGSCSRGRGGIGCGTRSRYRCWRGGTCGDATWTIPRSCRHNDAGGSAPSHNWRPR